MGPPDLPLAGFSWRSGSARDTSGILMWNDAFLYTVPRTGEKLAIVIIDTQGLFDSETTPVNNSRIFVLGTLISSIQVFNLNSNVQEDQLQYLQFAAEFARFASENDENSEKFFQNIMFLIRDWVCKILLIED
jgi:atlastin